jgi:hypothetical protein
MEWAIRSKKPTAAGGQYEELVSTTTTFKAGTRWGGSFALGTLTQPPDALQVLQQRHSELLADDGCMCLRLEVAAMH